MSDDLDPIGSFITLSYNNDKGRWICDLGSVSLMEAKGALLTALDELKDKFDSAMLVYANGESINASDDEEDDTSEDS